MPPARTGPGSAGPASATRPTANAPRPPGACRVLMIGDLIGKPGRVAVEADPARPARGARHRLRHRQRRERRRRHGPDAVDRRVDPGQRRRRHHVAATTSGTSARSTRSSRPTTGSCGRSTTARTTSPVAAGACTSALDGTDVAVINLQGRTYMQPIENPFTDADRAARRGRPEPLPPVRLVDFHCELTSREERAGPVPRRSGQRRRRDPHARRDRRRADPAQRHRLPDRPRHDRPGLERHRVRAEDRPAALHQRPADALRGGRRARSSSTPSRSTSTRPPAGRSPSSGSSASSRPDGVRDAPASRTTRCRRPRRVVPPAPSTIDLHTHTTRSRRRPGPRRRSSRAAYDAGVRLLGLTDHDTLAGYREVVAAGAVPAGHDADPGRRDQRARDPRPRAVGGRAAHPRVRHGSRTTRRSRRPWPPSAISAGAASSGPSTGCATSACRSMPRSRTSIHGEDDALGRPTIARALMAAGFADERRGRLQPAHRARRAGLRAARGPGPEEAIAVDPGGRWRARSWPTSARRRAGATSCASSSKPGLAGLEVYYRSFDAGDRHRRRRGRHDARPARLPAAPTTTATSGRTRTAHAALWVPPEVGERCSTRLV